MDLTQVTWRKSSYSQGGGRQCVEIGYVWRKSSYSSGGGQECVEVAANVPGVIALRDSKNPTAGHHEVTPHTFHTLLTAIERGEL